MIHTCNLPAILPSSPLSGWVSTGLPGTVLDILSPSCSRPNLIGRPSPLMMVDMFNCLVLFLGPLFDAAIFNTWPGKTSERKTTVNKWLDNLGHTRLSLACCSSLFAPALSKGLLDQTDDGVVNKSLYSAPLAADRCSFSRVRDHQWDGTRSSVGILGPVPYNAWVG